MEHIYVTMTNNGEVQIREAGKNIIQKKLLNILSFVYDLII